jgi:ketosteroid isomerase-like protein
LARSELKWEDVMTETNRERLQRALEGFGAGDPHAYTALFTDDVLYHYPGRNPLSGDYRGKEAVLAFIERVSDLTGGTFAAQVHDVLGSDDHAASLLLVSAERDGRRMEWRAVGVYNFHEGKVTEAWVHPIVDQNELDSFLS